MRSDGAILKPSGSIKTAPTFNGPFVPFANNCSVPDVITFFANDNQLQVIASDDATKCTSATNIGPVEGNFKIDFKAKDMGELLNVIGTAGAIFCIEEGKPLCIELADKSFLYMVANVMNNKAA